MNTNTASTDPWAAYDQGNAYGKDKPKPIHPTPEPAMYGLTLALLCVLFVIIKKRK